MLRNAWLVVKGCTLDDTPNGSLKNMVFKERSCTRLTSPRLPILPVGTDDLYTGLLITELAQG